MKRIMRRLGLVILIVVIVLAVTVITVGIWQRENIVAVVKTFTSSTDEIAQEMDENKIQLENALKKQNINVVSDFTAEEEKQIIKGELSVEEAVARLMERYEKFEREMSSEQLSQNTQSYQTPSSTESLTKPSTSQTPASTDSASKSATSKAPSSTESSSKTSTSKTSSSTESSSKTSASKTPSSKIPASTSLSDKIASANPKVNKVVGEKAVKLYSLKAYYLGQLGQMEAKAKREYAALPSEKKNLIGKKDIVKRYMGTITGLMNQCDASVNEILDELKTELQGLNADISIVKDIRDAYENEKNLKKSYYLALLEE